MTLVHTPQRAILIVWFLALGAAAASADPGLPTADPAAFNVGASGTVRVTSLITDTNAIPASVNVQRLDATGRGIATLGVLRDAAELLRELVEVVEAHAAFDPSAAFTSFQAPLAGQYVLQLVVNDGIENGDPDTVVITVDPLPGRLTPSTLGLAFPATGINSRSLSQSVTFTNVGGRAVTFTGATVSGEFGIERNTCTVLAPQESCQVEVYFAPIASGPRSGELVSASDARNSPIRVSLNGNLDATPGDDPFVVASTIHLGGNWRIEYVDGDADDFWLLIGGEPPLHIDDGYERDVIVGSGVDWVLGFREDEDGLPPVPLLELHQIDPNTFLIHVDDSSSDNDDGLRLRLERLP